MYFLLTQQYNKKQILTTQISEIPLEQCSVECYSNVVFTDFEQVLSKDFRYLNQSIPSIHNYFHLQMKKYYKLLGYKWTMLYYSCQKLETNKKKTEKNQHFSDHVAHTNNFGMAYIFMRIFCPVWTQYARTTREFPVFQVLKCHMSIWYHKTIQNLT